MKGLFLRSVLSALTFASVALADVDPIVIKGSKFFYKTNGTQFFMKGIAYQQEVAAGGGSSSSNTNIDYQDPLADVAACKRDIPIMTELRTNTIRVYAIDPQKNHDECMKMLADAGIYVVADLSQPNLSINRDNPTWNDDLYARYAAVVDSLASYNNVLGFFAGNEVTNAINNTDASAFVKAAVRDTKAYIKSKNYRAIGVGYATNDDADIRDALAAYFNCGNVDDAIDFWGYNIYSWCGASSFTKSGYDKRTEAFANYSVPVFFAEYGCNEVRPRLFGDVPALYSSQMTDVWSGGIVYMYFEEANKYGLVSVKGSTVSKLPDFTSLSSQIAKATPTGVNMKDYTPSHTVPADCPSVGPTWAAASSPLPPVVNTDLCKCMYSSLSCVVAENTDEEKYGDIFGTVCGFNDQVCLGIASNATTGQYGAYSMCNAKEQLSFVLNRYYLSQNKASDACSFGGQAVLKSATATSSSCSPLISQAGENGQGTMTASPSGSGTSAANALQGPSLGVTFAGVAYMFVAVLSGAGMLFL